MHASGCARLCVHLASHRSPLVPSSAVRPFLVRAQGHLAQYFLVGYVLTEILEVHREFSVHDFVWERIHGARRWARHVRSIRSEDASMAWAVKLILVLAPCNGATHVRAD